MQCTQPSLPAAAAARGAYRATNSACPKAEQDPCKAVCNSFPLLPLAYSNSAAASSIWYSSSSSIVVQGSLGNFLIIKIESLLLLFLSHFSLQLCFTILFCSLFLFFEWHCWGSAVARVVATKPSVTSSKAKQRKRTDTAVGF